jgi:hypothetical protein
MIGILALFIIPNRKLKDLWLLLIFSFNSGAILFLLLGTKLSKWRRAANNA